MELAMQVVSSSIEQVIADIRPIMARMLGREIWLDSQDECVIFTVTEAVFAVESDLSNFVDFCIWHYAPEFTEQEIDFLEERCNLLDYLKG